MRDAIRIFEAIMRRILSRKQFRVSIMRLHNFLPIRRNVDYFLPLQYPFLHHFHYPLAKYNIHHHNHDTYYIDNSMQSIFLEVDLLIPHVMANRKEQHR